MLRFPASSARLLALLPPLLWAGCSDPLGPGDQLSLLLQHEAIWSRHGPASYRFTIQRFCECLQEQSGPVTVEVRNGSVETRRYQTGATVEPQFYDLFRSVPGLFELIRQAIELPAAAIAVRYDGTLGYPTSIQLDWVAGAVDDEVSYRISDFEPLSPT